MRALFTLLGIWTEVVLYWLAPYLTAFFLLMRNPAYDARAHNTRGYTTGLVRETIFGTPSIYQG